MPWLKRILCPIDLDADSTDTLAVALDLAEQYKASVCLLYVVGTPVAGPSEPISDWQRALSARFEKLAREWLEGRVPCQILIWSGDPAPAILRAAHDLDFLVGSLSIAALPPFNGFVSEWLTLQTMLQSAALGSTGVKIVFALCGAILALTAALAVTCFVKAFAMSFLGMSRSEAATQALRAQKSASVPMAFMAVLCLLLGVAPTYVIPVLDGAIAPIAEQARAADALVPPFFAGNVHHRELSSAFVADFHALGAQVGQSVIPGRGLVVLHRGGHENPVVFAMSTAYMVVVLALMLLAAYAVFRLIIARRRVVLRRAVWDGGIRRLLPEMTYTGTGFSNPVRVIFEAVFRPTTVEDTRETVGRHFRAAIRRTRGENHVLDRLVLNPIAESALWVSNGFARMHHGFLNAYVLYGLGALIAALLIARFS